MPKINKALAILAALAFLLPFVTISCNGRSLVQMSGAQLSKCAFSTCSSNDLIPPDLKRMMGKNAPNVSIPDSDKIPGIENANLVLFAAIACIGAALTLFFGGRGGELLSGVASVAAIVLLFLFRSKFGDAIAPHLHSSDLDAAAALVKFELQFSAGFWLSVVFSACSAILAFKGTAGPQGAVVRGAGNPSGGTSRQPAFVPPGGQQMSNCPTCASANHGGNKFCLSCGGSLAMAAPAARPPSETAIAPPAGTACPSCGASAAPGNKFCLSCGTPLPGPAPSVAVRPLASTRIDQPTSISDLPSSSASTPAPPVEAMAAAAVASPVAQPLPFPAPSAAETQPAPAAIETPVTSRSTIVESAPVPSGPVASVEPPKAKDLCASCGAAVASTQRFCLACGTPVSQVVEAAQPQTVPPADPAGFMPMPSSSQDPTGPFPASPRSGNTVWIILVVLLAIVGVAGWYVWKYFAGPDVTVAAFPQRIHVAAGGRTALRASVSGSSDTDVTWSVQEGAKGGQIKAQGAVMEAGQSRASATYTAPETSGTFHVIATSHANSNRSAKVEIIVGSTLQPDNAVAPTPALPAPAAANANATQILGAWRGPSSDMRTTINADSTITMDSDADPQKNLHGTYRFTDNSHLQVDFGNGDVRTWEILGVDGSYLRITSQSKDGVSAMIFSRLNG